MSILAEAALRSLGNGNGCGSCPAMMVLHDGRPVLAAPFPRPLRPLLAQEDCPDMLKAVRE